MTLGPCTAQASGVGAFLSSAGAGELRVVEGPATRGGLYVWSSGLLARGSATCQTDPRY